MLTRSFLLLTSASLGLCLPNPIQPRAAALPPKTSVTQLGLTKSTLPNIYRDGGGGATINGLNVIWFSDGIYTTDGKPPKSDFSNWANFTSNSLAVSGYQGQPITSLTDFGNSQKGPIQQIPYFYNNGENDGVTGIWPNEPLATLCDGKCGVSFPQVVNRTALNTPGGQADLYSTAVSVSFTGYGPVASRPVQRMFLRGEPKFGTFSSLTGIDGYLYTFAAIGNTTNANGLKMARVPQSSWSDRSQYSYWNGKAWTSTIPAYSDASSNIFNWSENLFGSVYGPGTGNLFYSPVYQTYLLLFQSGAGADNSIYLAYTPTNDLTKGFSSVTKIGTINGPNGGLSYSFNAYPNYDSTGKTVPISWASYSDSNSYQVSMANITFS